jgi:xylose isomerase
MGMSDVPRFHFSVGPWNLHTGADPFGPPVRPDRTLAEKLEIFKKLGFDYVQFHDDDVVSAEADRATLEKTAREVKRMLDDAGMKAEFVAPRLWEDPRTVDGPITSNRPEERAYALERSKRAVDLMHLLETDRMVLWPAREGTYIREAKDAVAASQQMLEFLNALLEYDPHLRILGEMKPNEPMDLMYWPSTGHFLAMAYRTCDPSRVGVLIESAHSILLGLDPADEMAYALWHGKLWGVHLNDQNGLKFDEDKAFGSVNLRRAFNQVDVLVRHGYGRNGEVVGLDVKAMRTQPFEIAYYHLRNSKEIFERLVEVSCSIDRSAWQSLVAARDYEGLEMMILRALMGK